MSLAVKSIEMGLIAKIRGGCKIDCGIWGATEGLQGVQKAKWVPDSKACICMEEGCNQVFSIVYRRHHCRTCGKVICDNCSGWRMKVTLFSELQRVCNTCAMDWIQRASKSILSKSTTEKTPALQNAALQQCESKRGETQMNDDERQTNNDERGQLSQELEKTGMELEAERKRNLDATMRLKAEKNSLEKDCKKLMIRLNNLNRSLADEETKTEKLENDLLRLKEELQIQKEEREQAETKLNIQNENLRNECTRLEKDIVSEKEKSRAKYAKLEIDLAAEKERCREALVVEKEKNHKNARKIHELEQTLLRSKEEMGNVHDQQTALEVKDRENILKIQELKDQLQKYRQQLARNPDKSTRIGRRLSRPNSGSFLVHVSDKVKSPSKNQAANGTTPKRDLAADKSKNTEDILGVTPTGLRSWWKRTPHYDVIDANDSPHGHHSQALA
eukprot:jgi/Bigna1/66010/fgenesh1_pg.1_\